MCPQKTTPKDPLKKTGYQLRLSVIQAVRDAVDRGAAESQNAFVERAVIRELKELRRRHLYEAYAQAAQDDAFLEDVRSTTEAFESTTGDGL